VGVCAAISQQSQNETKQNKTKQARENKNKFIHSF